MEREMEREQSTVKAFTESDAYEAYLEDAQVWKMMCAFKCGGFQESFEETSIEVVAKVRCVCSLNVNVDANE